MVKDTQVKGLMKMLSSGTSLQTASMKSGMCEDTGRHYRNVGRLPSQMKIPHDWKTRQDPFRDVWSTEIEPLLKNNPGLEAKTIFEVLTEKHAGVFGDGQLRTLQRRLRYWRATQGKARETFFPQDHIPGRLCESDFTEMKSLGITIQECPFEHLVYHFVLTYSNWEDGTVCFSESQESLSQGLQNALWKLGGSPLRHRNDCLSAAVNNLKNPKEFTDWHNGLMCYYGMEAERTNPNSGNEDGDVEQRHYRFKRAVDQALMLRGSRDFASREKYELFLNKLFERLNRGRQKEFSEEVACLLPLPPIRLPLYRELRDIRVGKASTIRVRSNVYSVHSRLIGQHVDAHLYADHIDIYYSRTFVEQLPRICGKGGHKINYRHVIDWLERKPGAFAMYRYRDDLFPSSQFRIAYDFLREISPSTADREYVHILYCAARHNEDLTGRALQQLIDEGTLQTHKDVEQLVEWWMQQESVPPYVGAVETVNLSSYDILLSAQGGC